MASLMLPTDCVLQSVSSIHGQLSQAALGGDVALDGSAVASIDIAGLQLLAASAQSAAAAGTGWRLDRPSEPLIAAMARAGIAFEPATGRFTSSEA